MRKRTNAVILNATSVDKKGIFALIVVDGIASVLYAAKKQINNNKDFG